MHARVIDAQSRETRCIDDSIKRKTETILRNIK